MVLFDAPARQFFVRNRVEESIVDDDGTLERAALPLRPRLYRDQPHDRLVVAGDDDLLARARLLDELREFRLRCMHVVDVHFAPLQMLANKLAKVDSARKVVPCWHRPTADRAHV